MGGSQDIKDGLIFGAIYWLVLLAVSPLHHVPRCKQANNSAKEGAVSS